MLVVYNPEKHQSVSVNELAERADGSQTIAVPESFSSGSGTRYIAFISPGREELSDSAYAGAVNMRKEKEE